jgi:hypothetical protein
MSQKNQVSVEDEDAVSRSVMRKLRMTSRKASLPCSSSPTTNRNNTSSLFSAADALCCRYADDVCGESVDVGDGGGGIWVQIDFYLEEIACKLSSGRIRVLRGIPRGNDEENAREEADGERGC